MYFWNFGREIDSAGMEIDVREFLRYDFSRFDTTEDTVKGIIG